MIKTMIKTLTLALTACLCLSPAAPVYALTDDLYEYALIHTIQARSFTEQDVDMIARTVFGEARGLSFDEKRLVVWTILQRVNDDRWPDSIQRVITQNNQFHGYSANHPVRYCIRDLVIEELEKWLMDEEPPVLYPFAPNAPYFFFAGRSGHNWFREIYK